MKTKFRVNVYIDGFNFYYGLKNKGWKKYYWLDVVKFYEQFIKDNQELIQLYYCTAKTTNKGQGERQSKFFQANNLNKKFNLIYGKFLEKTVTFGGKQFKTFEEKQTDVNIAISLIRNIVFDNCDTSIIVSADSDLVPAIKLAKEINPNHKIYVHFPPERTSVQLQNISDGVIHLHRYEKRFQNCLLPDEILVNQEKGIKISRPLSWK